MIEKLLRVGHRFVDLIDGLPNRYKVKLITLLICWTFVTILTGTVLYSPALSA